MSLDLSQTAAQLYDAAPRLTERREAQLQALARAVGLLGSVDPDAVEQRRAEGKATFLVAGLDGKLAGATPVPPLPPDHVVVAVDGSHIDVDRHSPAKLFLINTGYVSLRYGELPDAALWNTPTLFHDDDALVLRDTVSTKEVPIEGPVLGMLRAVMEVEALADLVEEVPEGLPVLALLDGSLILWGLTGGAFPDFVRDQLLEERLVPALDRLRKLAESRTLAVASHVSLPRSTDVVNALRVAPEVCRWDKVNCDGNCGALVRGTRNCDTVGGVTDADVFAATLRPGERSPLFRTTSSIVGDYYGAHQVRFFYANLGEEVARVEMPEWSAETPQALDLAHAGLLAQSDKGHGYPVALQEAHEQAVVSGADRDYFAQLVEEMLTAERLPTGTSQKARSKRTRFV
ncbi:MAG: DNA double-strand break repair nuclease NurA [Dehalococcoidia bacterium]